MECTKLLSEHFETAAYALKHAFERFESNGIGENVEILRRLGDTFTSDVQQFTLATEQQRLNINNYVRVQNMVAENLQALAEGKQRPYAPNAFLECLTPKVGGL